MTMSSKYIGIGLITLWALNSQAQNYVKLDTPTNIDRLMERFVQNGKSVETVKAWRIQIVTTNDPGISTDWKHVAPYYQVRVGYYENKNRLMPFLLELKKTFPSATPVYDNISKRSLVY
jgi:hypothetical protein